VKKVLFVYILKLLLEGPQRGFFNLLKKSWKAEKWKKQQKAWKKTYEAQKKKRVSVGKPTSSSEVPLSLQCPQASSSREASMTLSLAEEELKVLKFKSQKGILTKAKNVQLAMLREMGGSIETADHGHGPGTLAEG
jgi:hypothetical protein